MLGRRWALALLRYPTGGVARAEKSEEMKEEQWMFVTSSNAIRRRLNDEERGLQHFTETKVSDKTFGDSRRIC